MQLKFFLISIYVGYQKFVGLPEICWLPKICWLPEIARSDTERERERYILKQTAG